MKIQKSTLSIFYYWINERHRIFLRRQEGEKAPWTKDPILQTYKFTNPFRSNDRTTVWFHDIISKHYNPEYGAGNLLLNCALFRYFGTIEFWDALREYGRRWFIDVSHKNDQDIITNAAKNRMKRGERVYTGAYMINNISSTGVKAETLMERVFIPLSLDMSTLSKRIAASPQLETTFNMLQTYTGFGGGGFMAYEVVTDMRHFPPLNCASDINTWANPGPGALRGLSRLYGEKVKYADALPLMVDLLNRCWSDGNGLDYVVPVLELRDVEHSLCEFDKYMRVQKGEGRPRSKFPKGAGGSFFE